MSPRACSSGSWNWDRCGRWLFGRRVVDVIPVVGLGKHVGRLDPVS
jgi:hypothetical protein